jgi:hypothetical protein
MARPAEPWVFGVARLGQSRRSRLPHDTARPRLGFRVRLDRLLKLEQQRRILVSREESKKHTIRQLERAARTGPLQLQEPPILRDGAHVFYALGRGSHQAQEIAPPDSVVFLLLDDCQRGLGFGDGEVGGLNSFGRGVPLRCQLAVRAVPDGRSGIFEKPGERYPVLRRQFQNGSRGTVGAQAAAKIAGKRVSG